MAESSKKGTGHRAAVGHVRRGRSFSVDLPVVGRVRIPPPEQLAFYGALGGLAAAQIIEWPLALVLGVGHALQQMDNDRVAQQVGEALEDV